MTTIRQRFLAATEEPRSKLRAVQAELAALDTEENHHRPSHFRLVRISDRRHDLKALQTVLQRQIDERAAEELAR